MFAGILLLTGFVLHRRNPIWPGVYDGVTAYPYATVGNIFREKVIDLFTYGSSKTSLPKKFQKHSI